MVSENDRSTQILRGVISGGGKLMHCWGIGNKLQRIYIWHLNLTMTRRLLQH